MANNNGIEILSNPAKVDAANRRALNSTALFILTGIKATKGDAEYIDFCADVDALQGLENIIAEAGLTTMIVAFLDALTHDPRPEVPGMNITKAFVAGYLAGPETAKAALEAMAAKKKAEGPLATAITRSAVKPGEVKRKNRKD
jgi:hypothetical protein